MIFRHATILEIGNNISVKHRPAIIKRIDCLKTPFSPQFSRNIKILEHFEPRRIRRIKRQSIIIGKTGFRTVIPERL